MPSWFLSKLLKTFGLIVEHQSLITRAFIAWGIGIGILIISPSHQFDSRFDLREVQNISDKILILNIEKNAFRDKPKTFPHKNWNIDPKSSSTQVAYWNSRKWNQLINRLLDSGAKAIGITFVFSSKNTAKYKIFSDPRVHWAGQEVIDPNKSNTPPQKNVYFIEVKPDKDGVVRSLSSKELNENHFGISIAKKVKEISINKQNFLDINFRGPKGTFPTISYNDLKNKHYDSSFFEGKVILVGSLQSNFYETKTPIGPMPIVETLANVVDNYLENRWIKNLNFWIYVLYLFIILIITVLILTNIPQGIAVTYLILIAAGFSSLSVASFDTINFWIPVLAPCVQILTTYILFLSYQITRNEYITWKLEEEQKLISQTQQLKNNFVSLISHDLKTPIAKMQGICDRLLSLNPENTFSNDLKTLRKETTELNRYIQSILQITKVESQDFKLNKMPCDINNVIKKVINDLKFIFLEKNIEIKTSFDPLFTIDLDPILIYEVILNIVENAAKYCQGGCLEIQTYETVTHIHAVFKDNGPGINPDDLDYIFEKFYRAKNTKNSTKGTGLGLYLVKYFIELHGGSISLNSKVGQGTQVYIKLPID